MSDTPTCPRPACGRPIPDTAYVCERCAGVLAVALRNAAANWDEVEAAVARQTAIAGSAGPTDGPRTLHGPLCATCLHDSCLTVRKSQIRGRVEDPIPGETNLVSFAAMEEAWIVTNTATTWARLINEESGRPIPKPSAPPSSRADPKRGVVRREPTREEVLAAFNAWAKPRDLVATKAPSPALCDYSWLPIEVCACGHPHPTKEDR